MSKKGGGSRKKKEDISIPIFKIYLGEPSEEFVCIMYRKICGQLGIDPLTSMKKYLVPEEDREAPLTQFCFSDENLGPAGTRAIVNAIMAQSLGSTPFKYKPWPFCKNYRLWKCNCCDAGALAFANLLQQCETMEMPFQCLDLTYNNIGHEGVTEIGRVLSVGYNMSLQSLILDQNPIGDDGCVGLCKGLLTNVTLKKLSLNFCGIKEVGCGGLAELIMEKNSGILELYLEGNGFGINGLIILSNALRRNAKITTINLCDNNVSEFPVTKTLTDALTLFGQMMFDNMVLINVFFERNLITEEGAKALQPFLNVETNDHTLQFTCDQTLPPEIFNSIFRNITKKKKKKGGKKKKK